MSYIDRYCAPAPTARAWERVRRLPLTWRFWAAVLLAIFLLAIALVQAGVIDLSPGFTVADRVEVRDGWVAAGWIEITNLRDEPLTVTGVSVDRRSRKFDAPPGTPDGRPTRDPANPWPRTVGPGGKVVAVYRVPSGENSYGYQVPNVTVQTRRGAFKVYRRDFR